MGYFEVMELPIDAFWLMNRNIGRIQATEDVRSLEVAISAQSGEGFKSQRERLIAETGVVFKGAQVYDDERDQAGFEELKALAALM
jgi:hypothetical protein